MNAITAVFSKSNEEFEVEQLKRCNQKGCNDIPAYRFTWPGTNEAAVCENHSRYVKGVASALGMYIQLIPIEPSK